MTAKLAHQSECVDSLDRKENEDPGGDVLRGPTTASQVGVSGLGILARVYLVIRIFGICSSPVTPLNRVAFAQ